MFDETASNTDTDTNTDHHISIPNLNFSNYETKNKYNIFQKKIQNREITNTTNAI